MRTRNVLVAGLALVGIFGTPSAWAGRCEGFCPVVGLHAQLPPGGALVLGVRDGWRLEGVRWQAPSFGAFDHSESSHLRVGFAPDWIDGRDEAGAGWTVAVPLLLGAERHDETHEESGGLGLMKHYWAATANVGLEAIRWWAGCSPCSRWRRLTPSATETWG